LRRRMVTRSSADQNPLSAGSSAGATRGVPRSIARLDKTIGVGNGGVSKNTGVISRIYAGQVARPGFRGTRRRIVIIPCQSHRCRGRQAESRGGRDSNALQSTHDKCPPFLARSTNDGCPWSFKRHSGSGPASDHDCSILTRQWTRSPSVEWRLEVTVTKWRVGALNPPLRAREPNETR
jgi:hypothetical protein